MNFMTNELIIWMFREMHINTLDIAKKMNLTEADVYNILSIRKRIGSQTNMSSPEAFRQSSLRVGAVRRSLEITRARMS